MTRAGVRGARASVFVAIVSGLMIGGVGGITVPEQVGCILDQLKDLWCH